jgi:predicted ATP-dependent endonuclease of OLD family
MKISKLHIDQFRHLENLDFDFTYQSGERKGQPLDKICFIGQSATGKTGLLELINEQIMCALHINLLNGNTDSASVFSEYLPELNGEIELLFDKLKFSRKNEKFFFNNKSYNIKRQSGYGEELIPIKKEKIIYFKANLISDKNIEIFTKNPIDLFEKHSDATNVNLENLLDNLPPYVKLFNNDVGSKQWLLLLDEILEYRKNNYQKMSEIFNKGFHKGLTDDINKLRLEYAKWQTENPNKLEAFAEKFNPILEKLNLEVDLVNTEYSIPIKNKRNDEIIPIQNTSTGTKGLLLSFLPLFKLDTKDSIILIDEPERSLYPDMQMDLMEYYQNLAPEAQFIVATHSPFIAASFEQDERFILYFDEEGKVAVRRGTSPIGDDPNDMLKNDFRVNYYNKHGEEAYQKYITLKQEVANETDPKRKKELLLETVKLGDIYNF